LDLIRDNVIKKCDSIDGVRDGVIDDPTKCKFSIDSLSCRHGQASVVNNSTICLDSTHINTVKAFYAGPGSKVYPGFAKGSESEWLVQESALYVQYAVPILQNLVYRNLRYDYTTFDFQKDVKVVDKVASPLITAASPNLDAFKARGGKLLVTQGELSPFIIQQTHTNLSTGWADPFNAPSWPIEQLSKGREIHGKNLDDFWRLFMVPGGGHCGSASSYPQVSGTWHTLEALVPWVEEGKAPSYVLATDPADGSGTTKRLCPYPVHAVHEHGPTDEYSSYVCR
jgi:feruloyl esterase